jgi:hypothetical protein
VTACRRELKQYQCDIHPHEQASLRATQSARTQGESGEYVAPLRQYLSLDGEG